MAFGVALAFLAEYAVWYGGNDELKLVAFLVVT